MGALPIARVSRVCLVVLPKQELQNLYFYLPVTTSLEGRGTRYSRIGFHGGGGYSPKTWVGRGPSGPGRLALKLINYTRNKTFNSLLDSRILQSWPVLYRVCGLLTKGRDGRQAVGGTRRPTPYPVDMVDYLQIWRLQKLCSKATAQ